MKKIPILCAMHCSDFTAESGLAWWAVQEAAKNVTLSRLRTPFGSPTDLFASLEEGLQQALAVSAQTQHADPFPAHQDAWLLLEFIDALERNIHSAAEGSVERSQLPQPVLAFFVANCKACQLPMSHSSATGLNISIDFEKSEALYQAVLSPSPCKISLYILDTPLQYAQLALRQCYPHDNRKCVD